ncbi:hypothetical protein SADUNF_Sadunf08G0043400 [Salix dunnii]|uniref:Glycosyltransferase 2-like domain-containing protein n=1 Tax=Salix dunnii TaxID=1413687 RepID=A0A835JZC5_9ROSI|nr:hypothetical protein SADUNF_Sadunf08G0043400 [Salix dunnii]
MGFLWTIAQLLVAVIFIVASFLLTAVVSEAYRRRHDNMHVDAPSFFEYPNSQKQLPSPHIHDPAEKYISLVIPAFNEEHRLPGTLDETINYLQERAGKDKSFTYEVVIVDDGSDDATKQVAFDFVKKYTMDNVRVILLGRNHGKGEAIRICGFKMFTRAAAQKLFTNLRLKRQCAVQYGYWHIITTQGADCKGVGWCFDVELVFLCKWFGFPVIEISVKWTEIPGSKLNPLSIPNMLWELALMSMGYRTRLWKICS